MYKTIRRWQHPLFDIYQALTSEAATLWEIEHLPGSSPVSFIHVREGQVIATHPTEPTLTLSAGELASVYMPDTGNPPPGVWTFTTPGPAMWMCYVFKADRLNRVAISIPDGGSQLISPIPGRTNYLAVSSGEIDIEGNEIAVGNVVEFSRDITVTNIEPGEASLLAHMYT